MRPLDAQMYFVLGSTFAVGVIAGMFFYVTVYVPMYGGSDVPEEFSMLVEGRMYGGCERTGSCASFQFTDDGSYQYFPSEGARKESGELPTSVVNSVRDELTPIAVEDASAPTAIRDCRSYVDGIDYAYTITVESQQFALDTCKTQLAHENPLQQEFLAVWQYMENPSSTRQYPVIIEEGVSGFIIDRLQGGSEE